MGDIGRTGRRLTLLALMGLVAVLAFWAFFGSTSADYVGSEKCGDCHDGNYDDWRGTLHGIDFSSEWEYGGGITNKYTLRGPDPQNGTFGYCAPCHMVGFNDEANGGVREAEPWNSTHNLPLGSIGCENCHGPGSDHVDDRSGNPEYMDVGEFSYSLSCAGWSTVSNEERPGGSFGGEDIVMCHDGGRMGGTEYAEGYYASGHAGGIGPGSPKGRADCYHCMAANGFISITVNGEDRPADEDFVEDPEGVWRVDGELVVYGIYCGVCHDPHEHSDETHYQLRLPEDEICEACHYNTHIFPDTHVRHPTTEFRNGINGKDVPVIEFMADVACPECHMYGTGRGTPDEDVILGHRFHVTPQACVDCHSVYSNETAQAWIDGVQAQFDDWVASFGDDTSGLKFEAHERMVWLVDNDILTEDANMTYLEAEWNYEYPYRDGSSGAHNPDFMTAMFASATEKFEMFLEDTEMGGVEGTLTWADGGAIEGAMIKSGSTTMATTDADGMYFFWADSGVRNFIVEDAEGNLLGSINAEVTTMQNVTKDVAFEEPSTGDGDGDGDDETDSMYYVFIGIIVLLIIILIVVAMQGKKE